MKHKSLRKAINDKCKSCIYDSTNGGTWRQQVELCAVTTCPLYALRPLAMPRGNGQNGAKTKASGQI